MYSKEELSIMKNVVYDYDKLSRDIKTKIEKGYDIVVDYVNNLMVDVDVFDMMLHLCADYDPELFRFVDRRIFHNNEFHRCAQLCQQHRPGT